MTTTIHDLNERKAAMESSGGPPNSKPGEQVEEVIKMMNDDEAIRAIKNEAHVISIGSAEDQREVRLLPLSPRQAMQAWPLIKKLIVPILTIAKSAQEGQSMSLSDIMESLGEDNIEALPKFLALVLQRGNPGLTEDWIMDNLDLVLDLKTILPIFMKINMFDKLLGGKSTPPPAGSSIDELPKPKDAAAAVVTKANSQG